MLSMYSDAVHVYRALQAGATGYIVKKSVAKEVVDAIWRAIDEAPGEAEHEQIEESPHRWSTLAP